MRLPEFPWDTLRQVTDLARSHADGIVDLSVGTPVDPTPECAARALREAVEWPGYPTTLGTIEVREALLAYLTGRWRAVDIDTSSIIPAIGTKELVAWLPTLLGLGADDVVAFPRVAYPTYEVGALLCSARPVRLPDHPEQWSGPTPKLVWLNSPSNPTGEVWDVDRLRSWVDWARSVGAVVASDECYGEFGWEAEPVSVLDPRVNGGSVAGLLAAHSMSKRSNVAGYRLGFLAGDRQLVGTILEVRKHAGLMMPGPMQHVMAVLAGDTDHVAVQRERYRARRERLRPVLEANGFRIDHSEAGLYLWGTRGEPCRETVAWLAERGVLVAPGEFYGPSGSEHVRIALTATDERVAAAVERLS